MKSKKPKTEKEEVEKSLGDYQALEAVSISEGGKLLVENLRADVIGAIDMLVSKPSAFTLMEYMEYTLKIKERLDLIRILTRAGKNKTFYTEELKRIITEEDPENV